MTLLAVFLSAQVVLADTEISAKDINSIVIKELSTPATFEVTVNNDNGVYNNYVIDTLLDIVITPNDLGGIESKTKKTFSIEVDPSADMRERSSGLIAFEYFVKGSKSGTVKSTMVINLKSFEEITDIILPTSLAADAERIEIAFRFNEDISKDIELSIVSDFFSEELELKLSDEVVKKTFPLDLKDKTAGVYDLTFNFVIDGEEVTVVKELILGSVVDILENEENSGKFLSRTSKITKTNNGNSLTDISIVVEKSVLASLFTSFSGEPRTKKESGKYIYEWSQELNPGESLEVTIKTSYYLPFIVLLLIILAVIVFKIVTAPQVKITKKAVRVRTKSGIFASRMIVNVKNIGNPITNVKVIERLPAFTEILRDKFGFVTPSEIKKRTVIWDFEKLGKGEEIMFSYVVYSKINVFGKLEVPSAVVTYRDDKDEFREEMSNKIYILSEDDKRPEEY